MSQFFLNFLNCINIVTHTPHQLVEVMYKKSFLKSIKLCKYRDPRSTSGGGGRAPNRRFPTANKNERRRSMNFSSRQAVRLHTLSRQLNMSVFMDLNVCYTPDRNRLRSLVEAAANRECVHPPPTSVLNRKL